MRRVVIDTSALVCFRYRENQWRNVAPLIKAIVNGKVVAFAPEHSLLELMHATRSKAITAGVSDRTRFIRSHTDWFMALPIQYVAIDYLHSQRELRLLVNRGLGSYDAVFVWLARDRSATLCTRDRGQIGGAPASVRKCDLRSVAFR